MNDIEHKAVQAAVKVIIACGHADITRIAGEAILAQSRMLSADSTATAAWAAHERDNALKFLGL